MESFVVGALFVVAGALVWWAHYPARWEKWRYSISWQGQYREARATLRGARSHRHTVKNEIARTLSRAKAATMRDVGRTTEQLLRLEHQYSELVRYEPGDKVDDLGELVLHEHELRFVDARLMEGETTQVLRRTVRLTGLTVEPRPLGRESTFLRVTWADGMDGAEYPHPAYRRGQVERFANLIYTQVKRDERYWRDRRDEAEALGATIQELKAALQQQRAAGDQEYQRLEEELRPRQDDTDAAWKAARETWSQLAGLRPWR